MKLSYALFTFFLFAVFTGTSSTLFANSYRTEQNKTISYSDIGNGTPLVLIHAFPTDKNLWKPQVDELKNHFL